MSSEFYIEAEKARKLADEQQRTQYSHAVAGKSLQAAEQSARAAKMAAIAALLAAAASVGQLIVTVVVWAIK